MATTTDAVRDVLLARWEELGDKVVRLVEAVPAAAWERAPVAEVRGVGAHVRHLAFWNAYAAGVLRGASPDGGADELPRDATPDKAAGVEALRASFADVRDAAGAAPLGAREVDTLVAFLEHAGEHYGQLVVHARLAGVVPPASVASAAG